MAVHSPKHMVLIGIDPYPYGEIVILMSQSGPKRAYLGMDLASLAAGWTNFTTGCCTIALGFPHPLVKSHGFAGEIPGNERRS